MCENKLETAVLAALDHAEAAKEALNTLRFEDARQNRTAYELDRRLDTMRIFEDRDIDEIERFLAPLLQKIEDGRVTEVIPDEHCPQGYWRNHMLTPEAEEISEAIRPIRLLLKSLKRVQLLRRADAILDRICTQDRT